jgi:hypothetical protein
MQDMVADLVNEVGDRSLRTDEFTVKMFLEDYMRERLQAIEEGRERVPRKLDVKSARRVLNRKAQDGVLSKRKVCHKGHQVNAYSKEA